MKKSVILDEKYIYSFRYYFINKNGSINGIYKNTKPKSLKRIKSKGKVLAVLEINAGEANKNNIGNGSFIDLRSLFPLLGCMKLL